MSPESGGISPTGSKENYDLEDIICLKKAKPKLHPASNWFREKTCAKGWMTLQDIEICLSGHQSLSSSSYLFLNIRMY